VDTLNESENDSTMSSPKALPSGVFPTMITPFVADGSAIDYGVLDSLIEWYIASGVTGLFACCLSSEMYDLSPDERLALARHVATKAAGRVAVVASGTFGGSVEEQAAFVVKMGAEVDAVVVMTCHLAGEDEGAEVWSANAEKLLSLTGDTPLGLYECPVPYKRVVTPAQLGWAARSGRFLFHKDTCCDTAEIKAKLEAVAGLETPFRFYNANVETIAYSNGLGGAGFSGISANFYPWLLVRACDPACSEPDRARIQRFLSVAEVVVCDGYPRSAKAYLAQYGTVPIGETCRKAAVKDIEYNEVQRLHFSHMKGLMEDICAALDEPVTPVTPQ